MALISRALPKALDGNDLQERSIAMDERLGDLAAARSGLDDAISVVRGMSRPQVYMVQNVSFLCDAVWNLWQRTGDKLFLTHNAVVAKNGARLAKQDRAGTPLAALAAGDAAWFRGKRAVAERHWRTSAEAAGKPSDDGGPGWQVLLARPGVERPRIWSIASA